MNTCPCCSDQLIRHVRQSQIYWFCPTCWQEMPDLAETIARALQARNKPLEDLQLA
ncbi:MAG: hypothetical protein SWY16_10165 [Cyanobacteriota bacterium]|nr:hypothetical protein [Cyanobacteriota bacterium]